jgi:RHS repeat-associated protein
MAQVPTVEKNNHNGGTAGKAATKSNAISIPQITLPKGGAALKSIDEKFSVNAANGTASFSIPLPVTTARGGFQPSLALSYDSGAGNGPFGLGWSVDLPMIRRKTDKKLPRYIDNEDSDTFIVSAAEELVPQLIKTGNEWKQDEEEVGDYRIKRYRPRTEGAFARIEKIKTSAAVFWKVTTKDNIVTIFGRDRKCCIADPADEKKIFQWLPELSYDDKGNCIVFEYKEEDLKEVQHSLSEKNRIAGLARSSNKYIKRIRYGNVQPYYPAINNSYNPSLPQATDFLFEIIFDYGEHSTNETIGTVDWAVRKDCFSDYRAGFEIRTRRLCQRILFFHHFTNKEFELPPFNDERVAYLVRSLDLTYSSSGEGSDQPSELTYLRSVSQTGYRKKSAGYTQRSFPPIEFTYQMLQWNTTIKTVSPENIVNAPVGLSNNYYWVDLYNEGISGILTEQADGWYYKENLGADTGGNSQFTRARIVSPKPALSGLSTGELQWQDLEGDGNKQMVARLPGIHGFYEFSDEGEWTNFQSFKELPNIDWQDQNTRLIDLNGDGKADLLVTEENVFGWYASEGKFGYQSKATTLKQNDEEKGPAIVFADDTQTIFLADMSGDGLTDIVRIRNAEISYWPSLGYGKFGAKVSMENAPNFDHPDQFNPALIHLADISGTGATDIIYLGKNKFSAYLNLSGNAWSEPCRIDPFFSATPPNGISVVDLLGNGTSCIVGSSPLPADANDPMRYIDLMGGKKPHVMTGYKNNFGKETSFEYKSSSFYYLEDKKNGTPWITRLPFPVQCLSKVIVRDTVSDLRFTNQYKYHHGYFDHAEREFRGFGMVEQIDTEEFQWMQDTDAANATAPEFHEPPVLTKTWFHLGAYFRNSKIMEHYIHEYWFNDPQLKEQDPSYSTVEHNLREAVFMEELSTKELIEAHRACKGMVLRQEIFSLDGSDKEKLPFSVATHNCVIKKLQPAGKEHKAVFIVEESEAITYSYERNIKDPRIAHSLNIAFDEVGNILKNASVVYPRKTRPLALTENKIWEEQNKTHITISEYQYSNDILVPSAWRLRLPYETRTFELQEVRLPDEREYYLIEDFQEDFSEINYEEEFTPGMVQKRLIEHIRTIYLGNDLKPLPVGKQDSRGLVFESYQLTFTPGLLDDVYKQDNIVSKVDPAMLLEGKYIDLNNDGNWWIRSGTIQYFDTATETSNDAAQRFYTPLSFTDPFGATTTVTYYSNYFLFLQQTKDALENNSTVEKFDFRVLSPVRLKDMNANITEAAIDIMGLPAGMAMRGKGDEADDLDNFETDLTELQIRDFMNDPPAQAAQLLKQATTRIVYDFSAVPCKTATIIREEHYRNNNNSKLQFSVEYVDGMGNILLKKVQAEPGDAPWRDQDGRLVKLPNGELDLKHTDHRWVGNGRTILNNKGKPVKQYEPYFSNSHLYETEPELREMGVTAVLYYDAMGRLVRTNMPDGTFLKVEFDSWKQITHDAVDTVLESQWYRDRGSPSVTNPKPVGKDQQAAWYSAILSETPSITHLDSLGRACCTIQHNRTYKIDEITQLPVEITDSLNSTVTALDIEGNIRSVKDACGNTVMSYKYDMLGKQGYQNSMDAGERWVLNDCLGKPGFTWDSKAQRFKTTYDKLHRLLTITQEDPFSSIIINRWEYCDTKNLSNAEILTNQGKNLIGNKVTQYDSAGITKVVNYDFKGNVLKSSQQLCENYKQPPHWSLPVSVNLQEEIFYVTTDFDALNRPTNISTPHTLGNNNIPASVTTPFYNVANLLNEVKVNIRGSNQQTEFVTRIDYDAKGNRNAIYYKNNTVTRYIYDKITFRLQRLLTTANNGNDILQDIHYVYDAIGNITHIQDHSRETIFYNGQEVVAKNEYNYDGLYQLIRASGREHIGQNRINETFVYGNTNGINNRSFPFNNESSPTDIKALRNYIQQYQYDPVGNIIQVQHLATGATWTRKYLYNNNEADRAEMNINTLKKKNNQLLLTRIGNDSTAYQYDAHGNMLNLPHLPEMVFDNKDQLLQVDLGGGGKAFYNYDSNGQRFRKIIERNDGTSEERIYIGAIEILRKRDTSGNITKQIESLHIMDDTTRIAMVDTPVITNTNEVQVIRFVYSNHLGSSSIELNEVAEVISYEEYHPYGTTSLMDAKPAMGSAAKRYRYSAKERDDETGLIYFGLRFFAPWLARWINTDPDFLVDGLNLYFFTRGNPITFVDSIGTDSTKPALSEEVAKDFLTLVSHREKLGYKQGLATVTQPDFHHSENIKLLASIIIRTAEQTEDNCSNTHNAEALFDKGAYIFAEAYGIQEQFQETISAADEWRVNMQSRQRYKQDNYWSSELTKGEIENAKHRRYQARLFLFKNISDLVASAGGFKAKGSGAKNQNAQLKNQAQISQKQVSPTQRVTEIHASAKGSPKFNKLTPTVLLKTVEGKDLIARGPTKKLDSSQLEKLLPNEQPVLTRKDDKVGKTFVPKDQRIHPDIAVLVRAHFAKLTPEMLTVSGQEFCASCRSIIQSFGGVIINPWTAVFGPTVTPTSKR